MRYGREITGEDLRIHHKLVYIQKYSEALLNHPNLKQDEICQITGINKHTLRRYMKELGITSFYKHDLTIPRKYRKDPAGRLRSSISTKKLKASSISSKKLKAAEECNQPLRGPKHKGGNQHTEAPKSFITAPIYDYEGSSHNIIDLTPTPELESRLTEILNRNPYRSKRR